MEREILFTGIGGQGIQLAARTLAEAAITDGRRVQLFASYGGMMRGGNSDAMLVVADTDITAPPLVGGAWAAVVMHHEHADAVWSSLRPGGVALVNGSVVDPGCRPEPERDIAVVDVAALDLASELGAPVAASLVLVGALVAATGLVSPDALVDTPARVLPSYRAEAAEVNRRALEVGLASGVLSHPAWTDAVVR
ncbi:MAG: 2-oxoacid:acceptor oxidoreductase family protein [Acidimicrobiales bacterium]